MQGIIVDRHLLRDCQCLRLHVVIVRGLGSSILRTERTEETLARGTYAQLYQLIKTYHLEH